MFHQVSCVLIYRYHVFAGGGVRAVPAPQEDVSNEILTTDDMFTTDTEPPGPETTVASVTSASPAWGHSARPSHPCRRTCVEGQPPMTCHYKFAVEWYYAMSKACHDCSHNATDCYRQDCIAANGVKRPIISVNKMLPGPSVEVRKRVAGDLTLNYEYMYSRRPVLNCFTVSFINR